MLRACLYVATMACATFVADAQAVKDQTRIWDEEIYNESSIEGKKQWKLTMTSDAHDVITQYHQDNLPEGIKGKLSHSNNCLAITIFKNRLFAAWRTSYFHFASKTSKMFIMSAEVDDIENIQANQTFNWEKELEISIGKDAREPYFMVINDTLQFYFFMGGSNPLKFEPNQMWRQQYLGSTGNWSKKEPWGNIGEVAWQYQIENGTAYVGSYAVGNSSYFSLGGYKLLFNKSQDGINWEPVNAEEPITYVGGTSEVGWQFDLLGNFWGVLRNEHGDKSGWGSRMAHGQQGQTGSWKFKSGKSNPEIVESPRMFRHGNDLYLIGRSDPSGHFMNHEIWQWPLSSSLHHMTDLVWYSLRHHGNGIWKVNQETAELERVLTIPGCGDTSFASVVRLSKHKYLVANYSSPRGKCKYWPWIYGQVDPQGTAVYFMTLEFQEEDDEVIMQ